MIDVIKGWLDAGKLYIIIFVVLLYPAVFIWGDLHGRGQMQQLDLKAIVKQDQTTALDNKKAADAAIVQEETLSDKLNEIDGQKNETIPATNPDCQLSDDQLQYLQGLVDKANKS